MTEKEIEIDVIETDQTNRKPAGPYIGKKLDGVVIGILVGLRDSVTPLVVFPGNPADESIAARSTCRLSREDIGCQVALLFEGGDPSHPLVIGRIQHPERTAPTEEKNAVSVTLDGEQLILSAEREIVLRCGKASITLTRSGKVLIRGAYVLSRSSGANRIKGGSVQIN
jgi:hypothetical protein